MEKTNVAKEGLTRCDWCPATAEVFQGSRAACAVHRSYLESPQGGEKQAAAVPLPSLAASVEDLAKQMGA